MHDGTNPISVPLRVLFVCLGNICRSPAAQGVTDALASKYNLSQFLLTDSAGLYGGHEGQLPDQRMRIHASRRGYNLIHRSRPVTENDFSRFDLILAMDDSNYHNLRRMAPTTEDEAKVERMASYLRQHPGFDHVPDPYYEGSEGFELVLDLLEDACMGLIEQRVAPLMNK